MNIQAELLPSDGSAAQEVTLAGSNAVVESGALDRIVLQIPTGAVQCYVRRGDDLILVLENGEEIVLADYFRDDADGQPTLWLVSDDGNCFVGIDFADDVPGILEPIIGGGALGVGAAALPLPLLIGGLAAGVAGAVAIASAADDSDDGGRGDGHGGGDGRLQKPTINPSNGKEFTGTGKPGSIIEIDVNNDGTVEYRARVDQTGHWRVTPDHQLADGTKIAARAVDEDGHRSDKVVAVIDGVAPDAPVIEPSNGKVISGTAEPGATISVDVGNDGTIDYTTKADGKGNWRITPKEPLPSGTEVAATATDAAGNTSDPGFVLVEANPPSMPTVDQTDGDILTGTADPKVLVKIDIDGDGSVEYSVVAKADGSWGVDLKPDEADGTTIKVWATNAAGDSPKATVVVDAFAPETPHVNPTSGKTVTGTGEPGTIIEIDTDGQPGAEYSTVVDENGNWSIDPNPDLPDGTELTVTAVEDGHRSEPTKEVVDAVAPAAPVIDLTNGKLISGTAEAGATVFIDTDENGIPDYTTVADENGFWQVDPEPDVPDGWEVAAWAVDEAKNRSPNATAIVDAALPPAPHIDPTNGEIISGTAESNILVMVDVDNDGTADLSTTADSSGRWSVDPSPNLSHGGTVAAWTSNANGDSAKAMTVVDHVAPTAPVIDATNGKIVSGVAEAGSLVTVDIDGDGKADLSDTADAQGHWSVDPSPDLDDGDPVRAWATDAAGNKSGPGFAVVDNSVPRAPQVLRISDDTGRSANDGVTSDQTLVFSGKADAGALVEVSVDDKFVGTTQADAQGDWRFDYTTHVLPEGHHAVTARQTDASGSYSAESEALEVIVDTNGGGVVALAPDAPIVSGIRADTVFAGDGLTDDQTLIFYGLAEAKATVDVYLQDAATGNAEHIGTTIADDKGNWSFDYTNTVLEPGDYRIWATQTDLAGGGPSEPSAIFYAKVDPTAGFASMSAAATPMVLSADVTTTDTGIADDQLGDAAGIHLSAAEGETGNTLWVSGGGIDLDLKTVDKSADLAVVDIGGSGANTLTLDLDDVMDVTDGKGSLRIDADADDTVIASSFSKSGETQTVGETVYDAYTSGPATIWIEQTAHIG